jgi:hypothetical protein
MSVVCPRCGNLGYLEIMRVNNREYVRIVHIVGRKRVKHYIGAKDKYVYVEKLHKLDLTNLKDQDPALLIRNAIDNYIELARKISIKREKIIELLDKTKQLMRVLTLCASNLEKLHVELEQKLKLLEGDSH